MTERADRLEEARARLADVLGRAHAQMREIERERSLEPLEQRVSGRIIDAIDSVVAHSRDLLTGKETPPPTSSFYGTEPARDGKTVRLVFGDDNDTRALHAQAVLPVESIMPFINTMLSVVVNQMVDTQQVAQGAARPVEHISGLALRAEVIQTSANDCILVIGTADQKELRITLTEQLIETIRGAINRLGPRVGSLQIQGKVRRLAAPLVGRIDLSPWMRARSSNRATSSIGLSPSEVPSSRLGSDLAQEVAHSSYDPLDNGRLFAVWHPPGSECRICSYNTVAAS